MRREALPFVCWIKPQTAGDFVLKPQETRTGQVAHGGSENTIVERVAAGVGMHGKLDFIRRVAALRYYQAHSRAVLEGLNLHVDIQLFHARRGLEEPARGQDRLGDSRAEVGFADGPYPLAAGVVERARLQLTESPVAMDYGFHRDEVHQLVTAIGGDGIADPN